MVELAELSNAAPAEPTGAAGVRQVTVRQGVVDSTIISGDGNTVTIIHQYSRTGAEPEQPARSPTAFPPSPYKGLEAFYEEDADRFFGRNAVVDTLWHRLRDLQTPPLPGQPAKTRLLAIIGPSGSGKSSVARAGLIPELARRPVPVLANPRVAVVVPHTEPIEALATVLARLATNDPAPAAKTREFADEIRRAGQSGAPDGLRRIANVLPGADRYPLIVMVDQFEEVFTSATEAGRSRFIETLLDAACDSGGRITVVLTLRSDFLGATARYPALDSAIAACSELVPAMSEAELREAISLPAGRAAELAGIPDPLDRGTVELLAQETIGREGALPLLQFALNRIWEGLAAGTSPADTLRELDGVGGALAVEADRLLKDVAAAGKEDLVRRAFLAMVQLGEGVEDTRRRAKLSEIVAAGETPEEVMAILRRFASPGERLVTFASDRGETTLQVTHEQLIARWPRLRQWLSDWRADERFRRRLTAAANDWRNGQGGLWGPTELELLGRWRYRPGQAATPEQQDFIKASEAALQRQQRQVRRITILTRAAAAILLVLFLGTAALAVGLVGASVEADERTLAANEAALEAVQQTVRAQASVARLENEKGRRFEAASAALRSMVLPFTYREDLSQTELWVELARAYSADGFLAPPLQHAGPVWAAAFDRTGERVVTASLDATARIWNARTGEPIGKPLRHTGMVLSAAFDPTGERVVTASDDNTARIWDARTGEPIGAPLQHAARVWVASFNPTGERVVTGSDDHTARIWDTSTGVPVGKTLHHADSIWAAAFDPTGERVVTASIDKTARIWDARTGEPIGQPLQHTDSVWAVAFDPQGERVVTGSRDHTARIWNARTGEPIGKELLHRNRVWAVAFDPRGERVVTGSADHTARIWNARTGEGAGILLHHYGPVRAVGFDPTGERIITASQDNTARIWNARTGEPIGRPLEHTGAVWAASFDGKGERIVTASEDTTARIWDVRPGDLIGQPLRHQGTVKTAVFDPTGERVVTASNDKTARIWNARTGEPIGSPLQHVGVVNTAVFDPRGERIVTASADSTARIWDAATGRPIGRWLLHADDVAAASFDPTGERVVTASKDKTARIWDAHTGEPIGKPLQHAASVRAAAFDPTGERVVTASYDHTARIWDARTGEPIGKPLKHQDVVYVAAFDPKGERIVTASWDKTARIWDARTGESIGKPLQHARDVFDAAFDPTGQRIVTASEDTTARIWDASTGEPIGKPMQHADPVWGAAFDQTGERIVTASEDNTAQIWDARTGQPIGKALQHTDPVRAAPAFDPAGASVVTASLDHTARIWRAPPTGQALVEEILTVLGSNGPEPLKLADDRTQHEKYGTLMAKGIETLWGRVRAFLPSN
jgi:WD40 repeat protein